MLYSDVQIKLDELSQRRREAEDRFREAESRRYQESQHHSARMKMAQTQHYDNMRAKARSDAINASRAQATEEHNKRHLDQVERFHRDELETIRRSAEIKENEIKAKQKISSDKLAFEREKMELERETAAEIAFLTAKTNYEIAFMQQQGALMLSTQNHNYAIVVSELEFRQRLAETVLSQVISLSNKYIEIYARNSADITAIRTNEISLIYERTKNTAHIYHTAITTILNENIRHKHATEAREQEERNREKQRRHEMRMAMLQSGLRIDEITKTEFIKLVLRAMEGANEPDAQKWASDCFDEWERERKA